MIGELLFDRYEIVEKVGNGGMALVYRAKDVILNRFVAIKMLRQQFANDNEFIERFKREAQAAASLSHPNVVNIYDVGHTQETYFIIMEYVQGENLSELITKQAPLQEDLVIDIACQIALALSHAHQHGIVHRDIKPHNILITEDGRVKVTDFGIARAMSTANITQTGMVLGSVHYFSPEQARGINVESQSDLYSLGVVTYEMITGTVPFKGDTPISIALKQIQEDPVRPKEIRPDISKGMEDIILKLLAKDASARYQSAEQVIDEFKQLSEFEKSNQEFFPEKTRKMSAVDISEEVEEVAMPKKRVKKKKQGKSRLLLVFIIFLSVVGLVWGVQRILPALLFPDEVTIPDIVGMELDDAEATLNEKGLNIGIDREVFDNQIPENHVISQDPAANRDVKQNRTIFVRISKGAEYVEMPNVEGVSLREARLKLTQAGFILGNELDGFVPDLPINIVLDQSPPAEELVKKGSAVDLTINKGEEKEVMISLPDFRGESLDTAKEKLSELGLQLGNTWPEFSTTVEEGKIIEQNPPPNSEVESGWDVDFVYSQGLPRGATSPTEEVEDEIQRWTTESQWHSVEVRINVPEGPSQEVVILVVDDFGAREIYRETRSGGTSISRTVQGRGEDAKIQVYIGGRMFLDKYFKDLI